MSGANGAPEFKDVVGTLDELRALMGEPSEIALRKDIGRLDEHCRAFIARSPFVLVATADLKGRCDVSPKGDAPGFVLVVDDRTLLIPDRPGNKRFDGMRNLLENPRIGLIFLVPGSEETLRVNGRARIVRDPEWLGRLAAQGKTPQLAIAVEVEESFLHCAKCVKRSGLWEPARWPDREGLASPAQMFRDHAKINTMTVEELDQRLVVHDPEGHARELVGDALGLDPRLQQIDRGPDLRVLHRGDSGAGTPFRSRPAAAMVSTLSLSPGEEPTPVPPREEVITVGETKVQVVIGGQGDPLVVLHGAGGNRGWRRWMAAVGERYTVYAPTHPGFGRSDAADWMESIDDLARFYLWFLDVMGLSKVHLLGHSIGGWTAAELATMRPGVIDRLVLVSPTGLKPGEGEIRDIFFYPPDELLKFNVHDPATVPEWAELFGGKPGPAEIEIALRNREMTARLTWKPYMFNPRLPHFLPRVANPTLIVWGREDQIVPVICGEQYRRLLPNATLCVLERCGHSPLIEQPDVFANLVLDFLGRA